MDNGKCKGCNKKLTFIEASNCLRCLVCNPLTKQVPEEKPETRYVDVKLTEKRVREIVRDELENWHIPRPPVTRDEAKEVLSKPVFEEPDDTTETHMEAILKPDWRAQAKELGIPLFQRKKVDVVKDIEARLEPSFNK